MTFIQGSTNNLTIDDADLTLLNGNVHARGLTIAGIQVSVTHGLQTVSNVSNSTSNTIQFTSDTTGFVTTANAEIGKDLIVSGNVHVSSNASIAVDSNVVAEYTGPHGRGVATLKKYPEIVFESGKFDANDTTNTYVQAGYTVTTNATHENRVHEPWVIFNGNFTANDEWQISTNLGGDRYSETDGTYNSGVILAGSTVADQTYNGDWVQVSLPQKIKLSHMNLGTGVDYGDSRMPEEGVLLGSNNGTTWSNVLAFGQTSYQHSVFTKIDVNSSDYYSYYRMIWLKITAGNDSTHRNRASLALWELYGYEEDPPAGDTSIDTTFTSVMNTPQTTGANVYVDGNLGETFTNRVTGPTPTGTATTYNASGKYWELTGALTSNVTLEANTFLEGDQPHAVSVWFNSSNLEANVSNTCVFSVSDQEKLDSVNLDLQSNTWHNLTYAYQGEGGSRVTYLDGRKVAEDQAEDTFGEYPPFNMTGYSQGGYVVSASGEHSSPYLAHEAFNGTFADNGDCWLSTDATYDSNTGNYNGSANLGSDSGGTATPENGEWLKLEMPHKFVLDYISICGSTTTGVNPKDWKIYGSNDDKNWDVLLSKTNAITAAYNSGGGKEHVVGASKAYTYFALVVTKSGGLNGNHYIQVGELEFYGHRENDLVRLPDPTNVLKYPHIAMTGQPGTSTSISDLAHAQRGYIVTASSMYIDNATNPFQPWRAFNNETGSSLNGTAWVSTGQTNTYGGTGNTYGTVRSANLGSDSGGTATPENGEWLKIELPHKIVLSHIQMVGNSIDTSDHPKSFKLYGSTNGTTWVEVLTVSNTGVLNTSEGTTFTPGSTPDAYNYFGLVVTATQSRQNYVTVTELKLYGTGVDSIPIQIGGGNIDKVANFRVYDTFIDENQALEIWDAQKDEFGRAKSSMTLHKGRLGIGTTEPEGRLAILDEPHNLEEFPPRAMSGHETYFEGHGVFKASVSTTFGNYAGWNVFDNDLSDFAGTGNQSVWHNAAGEFTGATPGVYQGSNELGGNYGSWLKLELPYKIKPSHIEIHPRGYSSGYVENYSQNPKDFKILASNDDVYWDTLTTQTDAYFEGGWKRFNIPADKHYKYFAFIGTKTVSGAYLALREIRYFGTREQGQSVLHDGQLTLTKSLTVPRIGPALDADDTPRRDRLVVEYNTSTNPTFEGAVRDTSGRGLNGIMYNGATYDANEKALKFIGSSSTTVNSSDKIQSTYDWGSTAPAHTFSVWFKRTANLTDWEWICSFGQANVTGQNPGILISGDTHTEGGNIISFDIFNDQVTVQHTVGLHEWTHVVATFNAATTAWSVDNCKIYVNGELKAGTNAAAGTFNLVGNEITLGATHEGKRGFTGCISNFKLYDVALTAEEAKTLYNMGRLGNTIKTPLQIEAPVDIRGDIRYITNIRPLALPTMWDHEANGHFTRGIYPITGTQGGSKVYNMLCEPDWCGGGWMCAAQLPRGKDVVTTTVNLFEDEYGDPSNLAWSNDFAVPMNIFSNNSGYDLDVMLVIVGGTQAGRAGAGGARNGGIYRGVNLTQALNTGWPTNGVYPVNISTSGLASSPDGYLFYSRTPSGYNYQPYKANAGWRLSFASLDGYPMSYNDADINTMGWLVHTSGNNLQYTYSYVHGGGGSQNNHAGGTNTNWAAVRFFVRPKRY